MSGANDGKYLSMFPTFPRGISWSLSRPGLEITVRGTTIRKLARTWRHLHVTIKPIGGEQPVDKVVATDIEDVRFFSDHYFPAGMEVVLLVPQPGESATNIRLFAAIEGDGILPDDGRLKRRIVTPEDTFQRDGDAGPAAETPRLPRSWPPEDTPADGEGQEHR